MPNKLSIRIGVFSLALTLSQAVMASTIENAVDTTGLMGFIPLNYGDHTINSAVATGVEIDSYRFQGAAGGSLRLVVSTTSAGFDPVVQLRDSLGVVLQTSSCSGNNVFGQPITCSANIDQSLSSAGTFFLNLFDSGSDEAGSYTLHLDRYPPVNNWAGLAYDAPLADGLGHLGDSDYLAFSGAAGTGIQISLASTTGGVDPHLQLWSPTGAVLQDVACSGNNVFGQPITCSLAPQLNLSETGLYKLGIDDAGWDEGGTYQVSVSCLYGNCPSAAPAPVPLPAAVWLLGSGILGLIGVARRRTKA